jgi:hypothetical protein
VHAHRNKPATPFTKRWFCTRLHVGTVAEFLGLGLAQQVGPSRPACAMLVLGMVMMAPSAAHAAAITDTFLFENSNQSMWSEGNAAEWSVETFLGTKWGTYAGGSAIDKSIGLDVGVASVRAGIRTAGEIGIVPWAQASGGGISISLPVQATVTFPDSVGTNTYFKVSTSYSVQPGYEMRVTAPSFAAGVDGVFNMDNRLLD